MDNKFNKIAKIAAGALGLIGVIMLVRVMTADEEALATDIDIQSSVLDPFVSFTIMMLYLTTAIAVVFSIVNLVKHPAALKKSIISLVVLGVLFAIAYATASDAVVTGPNNTFIEGGEAGSTPKMVGALIKYTYILGVIGLATVVWGSVRSMMSNK
ncbi:MAG: hypothetical protein COB73_03290 [Flavobacteriaceae bacterium]|nr:MAG: hypothetical protein COB73_03290 [Flavobacteriaceae bacterium]